MPDIRNTRVIDIHRELAHYGIEAKAHDPLADPDEVEREYGLRLIADVDASGPFDAVILAVRHRVLAASFPLERLRGLGGERPPLVMDVKGFFRPAEYQVAGIDSWHL